MVEFEQGRRIAWCHVARHRWRYELESQRPDRTVVTETFDGRTALFPPALLAMNAFRTNQKGILVSLVRLKKAAEG